MSIDSQTRKRNGPVAVLGSGSWGATLAAHLHGNGVEVRLWCHSQREMDRLSKARHPPGVPELKLPELLVTTGLDEALEGAEAVVFVVPAQAMTEVTEKILQLDIYPSISIIASKGIDVKTRRVMSDVIQDALPKTRPLVISGPCIAKEVALGIPTSVVAACQEPGVLDLVLPWFVTNTFRVYRQPDILGVEICAALKNVIAIAAGISDGLGYGANSKSALLTRGLAEIRRLAMAMGADERTVSGLAGLGDLCVTCFSPHSRNRRFGEAIGKGESAGRAIETIGEVVEGLPTARAAVEIAREKNVEAPVAEAVCQIADGKWTPLQAVQNLMTRQLKSEFDDP